jgi:plasmid stabilization system protein ParE
LPIARQELEEALVWYEAKTPRLGVLFQSEAEHQMARIREHPLQFPVMHADIRRARMRRFPYGLYFRIEGDDIFVIACFHAARYPQNWQERV